jgi:hypothetical protein
MSDPDLTVEAVLGDDLRAWLMAELRYPVLAVNSADGSSTRRTSRRCSTSRIWRAGIAATPSATPGRSG